MVASSEYVIDYLFIERKVMSYWHILGVDQRRWCFIVKCLDFRGCVPARQYIVPYRYQHVWPLSAQNRKVGARGQLYVGLCCIFFCAFKFKSILGLDSWVSWNITCLYWQLVFWIKLLRKHWKQLDWRKFKKIKLAMQINGWFALIIFNQMRIYSHVYTCTLNI